MKQADLTFFAEILIRLASKAVSVQEFCSEVEEYVNFEYDSSSATTEESGAVRALFDVVVWYSPFETERDNYPGFVGEQEVFLAAHTFAELVVARQAR